MSKLERRRIWVTQKLNGLTRRGIRSLAAPPSVRGVNTVMLGGWRGGLLDGTAIQKARTNLTWRCIPTGSMNRCTGRGRSAFLCAVWVIVGGETGPGARPMHPDWVRSVRDQCTETDVPFFFKQWGTADPGPGARANANAAGRDEYKHGCGNLLDGQEWNEYPITHLSE